MRPPVSTWDLMTVGPPMRSAIAFASRRVGREPEVGDGDARPLDDLAGFVFEEAHEARNPMIGRRSALWHIEASERRRRRAPPEIPPAPHARRRWPVTTRQRHDGPPRRRRGRPRRPAPARRSSGASRSRSPRRWPTRSSTPTTASAAGEVRLRCWRGSGPVILEVRDAGAGSRPGRQPGPAAWGSRVDPPGADDVPIGPRLPGRGTARPARLRRGVAGGAGDPDPAGCSPDETN